MRVSEYPGLPKWPAMVVTGEPVTVEQAEEILVRTDDLYFSTNAQDVRKDFYKILGVPTNQYGDPFYTILQEVRQKLRVLPLAYLENRRILSAYVGGPHGWCDWSGDIFSNSYNIGKWPSVEGVREDWKVIAEAFPYLKLKCQLFSGECCEEGSKPVVEFRVSKGKVSVVEPKTVLPVSPDCFAKSLIYTLHLPPDTREVGVSFDNFEKIVKRLGL